MTQLVVAKVRRLVGLHGRHSDVRQRLRSRDAGSASLWVVGAVLIVIVAAVGVIDAGVAVVARHRAASAVDLTALAAASAANAAVADSIRQPLSVGATGVSAAAQASSACSVARRVAAANGVMLMRCSEGADGVVDITIGLTVRVAPYVATPSVVTARARAGPV